MPGTARVANEGDNGGPCPGKNPSDRVSGWAPWNVRRPNGLQIFFSAHPPSPSHRQVLKTSGRRPGGAVADPRVGPLALLRATHTTRNSCPCPPTATEGQGSPTAWTRSHLQICLLIHKMGRSSRPFLTRVGRHLRYALGREALGPVQMWDCGEGSGCTSGA